MIGLSLRLRRVVSAWTKVAEALNTLVATGLFAVCYLVIVPIFHLLLRPGDPLRLRARPERRTFWVTRRDAHAGPDSFERMA